MDGRALIFRTNKETKHIPLALALPCPSPPPPHPDRSPGGKKHSPSNTLTMSDVISHEEALGASRHLPYLHHPDEPALVLSLYDEP